jgi:ABC-type lipoprotein release transport system permease subunit
LAGAFALTRLLQSELFEVSATDPVTLVGAAAVLVAVAALATWLPAQRATRVSPMEVLRGE